MPSTADQISITTKVNQKPQGSTLSASQNLVLYKHPVMDITNGPDVGYNLLQRLFSPNNQYVLPKQQISSIHLETLTQKN